MPANLDFNPEFRGGHNCEVIARLARGRDPAGVRSRARGAREGVVREEGPKEHFIDAKHPMIAVPFQADLVGSLATALWLLQGAVLLVLLISIVNVANLLLARVGVADARGRRASRGGCEPAPVDPQFLTESVLLGVLGGVLGVLVAVWALDGVTALIPAPRRAPGDRP